MNFDLTPTNDPSETLITRIETLANDAAKRAEGGLFEPL